MEARPLLNTSNTLFISLDQYSASTCDLYRTHFCRVTIELDGRRRSRSGLGTRKGLRELSDRFSRLRRRNSELAY